MSTSHDCVAQAAARAGTEVLLARTQAQSYGSLRGTMLQIVDGEYAWRTLFEAGAPPTSELAESDFPTLEAIEARRREEESHLRRNRGIAERRRPRRHAEIHHRDGQDAPLVQI